MSHLVDDCYSVYRETRRTARISHKCSACAEAVAAGQTYWSIAWVWEGAARSIKRCERCQTLHLHLRKLGGGEMWPAEKLDCGEEYKDHWGAEPPADIAALAFALPGETKVGAKL